MHHSLQTESFGPSMLQGQAIPTPSSQHIHMLGWNMTKLVAELGEPFGEYHHRGRDVLMFVGDAGTLTCEMEEGFVVRINNHEERRTATRVKPSSKKMAFLRHGRCRHSVQILDLSVKSVSMLIPDGNLPLKGDVVTFCTGLRIRANTLVFVHLSANVHRTLEAERKVILLLHTPFDTHSYQAWVDHINIQVALSSIGRSIKESADRLPGIPPTTVIKSDLCALCEERACGLPGHKHLITSNRAPLQKGLSKQ